MPCVRTFCPDCGEEMIHRDNRHGHEASSAFNQIIHREGPAELAVGDIDTYVEKWRGSDVRLLLLEHKQPQQSLGRAQSRVLTDLDRIIRHATTHPIEGLSLDPSSGVFVIRGQLLAKDKKIDFAGPQVVERLDGTPALVPQQRKELWDWINGGADWTPRAGRGRWWR